MLHDRLPAFLSPAGVRRPVSSTRAAAVQAVRAHGSPLRSWRPEGSGSRCVCSPLGNALTTAYSRQAALPETSLHKIAASASHLKESCSPNAYSVGMPTASPYRLPFSLQALPLGLVSIHPRRLSRFATQTPLPLPVPQSGALDDGNTELCVLCGVGGSLLCCDSCPAAYHVKCIGESARSIPEGEWACPECALGGRGAWGGCEGACLSRAARLTP